MNDYIIGDLRIRIESSRSDLAGIGLNGFKPFIAPGGRITGDADCTLILDRECSTERFAPIETLSRFEFADADAECVFSATNAGYLLTITRRTQPGRTMIFHRDRASKCVTGNALCQEHTDISLLRFGLWVMIGISFVENDAIAIHSSTIVHRGHAVLFLGESGTGKSTHTRLWRENIEGARLLNDDSPVIRLSKDGVTAYGSPWSGKLPCYKNESYPIRAICRLSQAPHNRIRRLGTIEAIGALLPSCPPAFAYDAALQDCICHTLGEIIRRVPVYHLECLPDAEAAMLSCRTVYAE